MKTFITEDFLLNNEFARKLYHGFAAKQPIIDYHCHLPPAEIAEDRMFETVTKIWLEGDHYKWRAMRTLGIDEKFITGKASDKEKFDRWAYTVPFTMRNPLYHWTHLELKRYFGIDEMLNSDTAERTFATCNDHLSQAEYSVRNLLRRMNVETVCTTDDPTDSLAHHATIKTSGSKTLVLPTFRPDKAFAIENGKAYAEYLKRLGDVSQIAIDSFENLLTALQRRVDFFHAQGCRLSDHGLERIYFPERTGASLEDIFQKAIAQKPLSQDEVEVFKFTVLFELSRMYHAKGWTQQFHLGALRNTNQRMLGKLGPDTGFDSIGDFRQSETLAKFLNALDSTDQLAKTILYNLNPADNEVMGTMIGNFNDGSVKGKIQFGSAWWFLDQKDGMEKQINALSNLGLLSCFIGMLTDSRSFLSYPRHEYFRRILCNLIGKDVEHGELPQDETWLGKLVADICYGNASAYFNFSKTAQPVNQHA